MQRQEELSLSLEDVSDFRALPGNGLSAMMNGRELLGGNLAFIREHAAVDEAMENKAAELASQGKTPLFFSDSGKLLGIIAVADIIKEEAPQAIRELKNMGIRVVMLTGDNIRTARAIGAQAGVDHVVAGVLPDGKEAVIRTLKNYGKVTMVGDGINDAPALTRADIGIAIGAGTDVAIDAADVVLMQSKLSDVPAAIRLSRATLTNIHENLFWAFFYNVICIPVAAGCFVWAGLTLNPMLGAAAMSLSSFCVVSNALRLNLFKLHDAGRDKPIKNPVTLPPELFEEQPESSTEETDVRIADACDRESNDAGECAAGEIIILHISGMMCEHCENRVKAGLEALPGVSEAKADNEKETALVTLVGPVSEDELKKAIADAGYTLESIEKSEATDAAMIKTIVSIEGMVCEMCEKHVADAIRENFSVVSVSADHEKGFAEIVSAEALDTENLKKVIADAGYEFTGVAAETE
jgi:Cu2+-exporting ATPase